MKKVCLLFIISFAVHVQLIFSQDISIAVAAGIRFAMEDIVKGFNTVYPDIKVKVIYGSSGKLYQQIVNHAPFDVYFSADNLYPEKLDSLKLAETKPRLYAIGQLVLWSPSLDVTKGIALLTTNSVQKIAIANPALAPYGRRAVECLRYYNVYDAVQDKIVKGETVSQAAQFVATGNADVGLIALSLAISPEMMNKGQYFLIDKKSYADLEHSYVVVKNSETQKEVLTFVQFIESEQARKIFVKYGFDLPHKNPAKSD